MMAERRERIRSWWLQLHAEQNGSRGLGWTRRKPAFYHGRRPMGPQHDGWPERKNAANQLGTSKVDPSDPLLTRATGVKRRGYQKSLSRSTDHWPPLAKSAPRPASRP